MDGKAMGDRRGVSPVVSVALLLAIVVVLTTAVAAAVFGLNLGEAKAPSATLSFEVTGGDVVMTHEGGDVLVADQIVVLDQNGDELDGLDEELETGDRATIVESLAGVERVVVVWQDPDSDTESVLATFEL